MGCTAVGHFSDDEEGDVTKPYHLEGTFMRSTQVRSLSEVVTGSKDDHREGR